MFERHKKIDNKPVLKVEWKEYSGCNIWERVREIIIHAKEDVIHILQNYNREENLLKYLTKFLENNNSNK